MTAALDVTEVRAGLPDGRRAPQDGDPPAVLAKAS